jgi:hypothetical protein
MMEITFKKIKNNFPPFSNEALEIITFLFLKIIDCSLLLYRHPQET